MNRSKTAQLLNEWKSFLNEKEDPKFKKEDENSLRVKISIKDEFKEYCEDNSLLKYDNKTGTISGYNMKNRDINNKDTNFVLVKIDNVEKQFPDVCVERV